MLRILSIDGGGIRGIIPALILTELERRAGKPVAELFDLVAGTSTGGVLALALAVPDENDEPRYAASRLVPLYEQEGARIFRTRGWSPFTTLSSLLEERFPADGLEAVLHEYLGDKRLSDARTNVLITAYEIERRTPFLFRSHRAKTDPSHDFPMTLVARATSAAPTYFEPAKHARDTKGDYYALIDGGVFANNPTMCAYIETRDTRFFRTDEDTLVVSLGTGELTRPLPYEQARGWGLARWAQPLLSVVFDGVSDTTDFQVRRLCGDRDGEARYYRFQTTLTQGNDDLDDASRTNLRVLRLLAEDLIAERDKDLDTVARLLVTNITDAFTHTPGDAGTVPRQ